MEDLPEVIESVHVPIDIPIRPYLKDHAFNGRAVLPAVEAMETLAQAARRFRPSTSVSCMSGVTFDKFLYLDPAGEHLSAHGDISLDANGNVRAVLTTKTKSKHAVMARVKTHAVLTLPHPATPMPELPLDVASAPEGVCFSVQKDKIYPDLVAFGPSYRNVAGLHMTYQGAVAEIMTPAVGDVGAVRSNLLGSPFALDAAFHAACAWGQRFAGIVAFPVAVDRRRIYVPTLPAETYFVHVLPVQTDPALLVFDLRIYDREGCLHEACSGVRMRDVSGGKLRPPEWVGPAESPGATNRIAGGCEASAVIELAALSPFADQTLSQRERLRFVGMSGRRRKSYLAARLACKRIARRISKNDMRTAPGDITTVCADRPDHPCCPLTDGRSVFSCSVSHDARFAVAVAAGGRVGVDVEKASERLLKSRSLYMSEPEQVLNRRSHLGEVETAVRIWSVKEAAAKALDIPLADAWRRVEVCTVDFFESLFLVDGQDAWPAVHEMVEEHVFTLVCRPNARMF
jgi:phosphopantetheinyl transferase